MHDKLGCHFLKKTYLFLSSYPLWSIVVAPKIIENENILRQNKLEM